MGSSREPRSNNFSSLKTKQRERKNKYRKQIGQTIQRIALVDDKIDRVKIFIQRLQNQRQVSETPELTEGIEEKKSVLKELQRQRKSFAEVLKELKQEYKLKAQRRKFSRKRVGKSLKTLLKKADKADKKIIKFNEKLYKNLGYLMPIGTRLYFFSIANRETLLEFFVKLFDDKGFCELPLLSISDVLRFLQKLAHFETDSLGQLNVFLKGYWKSSGRITEYPEDMAQNLEIMDRHMLDERNSQFKKYVRIMQVIADKQSEKNRLRFESVEQEIEALQPKDLQTITNSLKVLLGRQTLKTGDAQNFMKRIFEIYRNYPLFLMPAYFQDYISEDISVFAQYFGFPRALVQNDNAYNQDFHMMFFSAQEFGFGGDENVKKTLFATVLGSLFFDVKKINFTNVSFQNLARRRKQFEHSLQNISYNKKNLKKINNLSNKVLRSMLNLVFAQYMVEKGALSYTRRKNMFGLNPLQRKRLALNYSQKDFKKLETAVRNINDIMRNALDQKQLGQSYLEKHQKSKFQLDDIFSDVLQPKRSNTRVLKRY